jgi:hypothetical protein
MQEIIVLLVVLLALVIIYFKAKGLLNTVNGKSAKGSCNCGTCSSSCPSRQWTEPVITKQLDPPGQTNDVLPPKDE